MTRKIPKDLILERAWIEINLDYLKHNIEEIKKLCPNNKIMAIVKANAYGHGGVEVAKKLSDIGITDFAVATLSEGIELRENGISGNILILGYTGINQLHYVIEYDLIQTIVDYDYAKQISRLVLPQKIKAHIKVNTGMNRIGFDFKNIESIKEVYHQSNIEVLGIFTHFCAADSPTTEDVQFSYDQIEKFDQVIRELKSSKINVGKTHMQSSYGILNYPELEYDLIRPGIIMYGIHSEKGIITRKNLNLKPVLSLKARITTIKELEENDYVSYGRTYQAKSKKKIASVSIGYADGYPRNLSGSGMKVLIGEKYAPIIGRICMDQLMIDISEIDTVQPGDIVTLLGQEKEISAEEIATRSGTITNELVSRLGSRLEYVFIDSKS
ncbi:MAG: serine racemase VanT catalytic subunit [Bacilli bacterium]|nr:serine racemase VanT catalytic subunit [Bacilli bacterium]